MAKIIKSWFVIMQEEEVMVFTNIFEKSLYEAIKSYCSNGKTTAALSIRDIQERATMSQGSVEEYLPKLIAKKYVEIIGTKTRRGGTCSIYKCTLCEHLKLIKCTPREHLATSKVYAPGAEVYATDAKVYTAPSRDLPQSNKVIKEERKKILDNTAAAIPADDRLDPKVRDRLWVEVEKWNAEKERMAK